MTYYIFTKKIISEKICNKKVFYPKIIRYENKIHKKYFNRKNILSEKYNHSY